MTQKPIAPPALDPASVAPRTGSAYPPPFAEPVRSRAKRALGDALGLTQYGVNLVTLEPGAWSSQRHWHAKEDEFIYVLEGQVTLVTDAGEQVLGPGQAAGFPAGKADGHHLINRSAGPVIYLEIGSRADDEQITYPDIDLAAKRVDGRWRFTRKDGRPYDAARDE